MKKILAEISLGELADKITILEIKMKKIILMLLSLQKFPITIYLISMHGVIKIK